MCSRFDKVYDWSLKVQIMGKKQEVAAQFIIDTLELPITIDEWVELIQKEYDNIFPTAQLLPGAARISEIFFLYIKIYFRSRKISKTFKKQ